MDSDLTGIAIVGMAGRFPGARNLQELWHNLRNGVESIARFSREEMLAAGVDPALVDHPRYVGAGGVLEGAELFDARLFSFTPREAALLDPQHRHFLEVVWEALEDAGLDSARPGGTIGVFAGEGFPRYLLNNLLPSGDLAQAETVTVLGNDKDFLATRVAYKLDLKGPALTVQTACSTSLVAVALACQSLMSYQCDVAVAGGASVRSPQTTGYLFEENGILSPDGHCRPFDHRAQGTVPGCGAGAVVLKRLEDALEQGDLIRAVIRGAALNNDGAAKAGYTAPSVSGQEEVLRTALAIADLSPRDITFVEGHGTATPLGDPIEFRALSRVFGEATDDRGFCALGSIKSNFGHTDSAAGVAGLIKTVLAMENHEIPPTLHFERPNLEIDLADSPFYVNAEAIPWQTGGTPRRAGVSSFGIGGTNAHLVLEEAPSRAAEDPGSQGPELLLLSAAGPESLSGASRRLGAHLASHPLPLADVARTLQLGRQQLGVRRFLVTADRAEAARILAAEDLERLATAAVPAGEPAIAFLFPGQGPRLTGLAPLYGSQPVYREAIDECADLLAPHIGRDLRRLLHPRSGEEDEAAALLAHTEIHQPALFAVEIALARLWRSWGIEPQALLGHSLGEYAAAHLSGVFDLTHGLRLTAARGRLGNRLPPGGMLSLPLGEAESEAMVGDSASIAGYNAPDRTVVAGPAEVLDRLAAEVESRGLDARRLPIAHSFHTRDVEPLLAEWIEEVRQTPLSPPQIPFLSNVTGDWITAAQATDPAYWAAHLRQPVRFADAVGRLLETPNRILLEAGPGQSATSLARRHPEAKKVRLLLASLFHRGDGPREPERGPHPWPLSRDGRGEPLPDRDRENLAEARAGVGSDAAILESLGRLWLAGARIDWNAVQPDRGRLVRLPTYAFHRERHWIERPAGPAASASLAAPAPEPATGWTAPLWREALAVAPAKASAARWVVFTDPYGLASQLMKLLRDRRLDPVGAAAGTAFARAGETAYTLSPEHPGGFETLLAEAAAGGLPLRLVYVWSAGDQPAALPGLSSLAAALAGETVLPVSLDVVTTHAASPGGERMAPGKAVLLSIARALGSRIPCRTIDVDLPSGPDDPELPRIAHRLADELSASPRGERVALRGRRRFVLGDEPVPEAAAPASPARASWLVAGDFADLGAELAERLAGEPKSQALWIGPEPGRRGEAAKAPWDGLPATAALVGWEEALASRLRLKTPEDVALLDDLAIRLLLRALGEAGTSTAPGSSATVAELRQSWRLLPRFERFLQWMIATLEKHGIVSVGAQQGESITFLPKAGEIGPAEDLLRSLGETKPHLKGLADLLAHSAGSYRQALSGDIEALSVIFPGGSTERLHQAVVQAEGGAEEPAFPLLAEVVRHLLVRSQGKPLRLLEIGAGQGLLTRELLPLLDGHDVEYHWTDLSRTFVLAAQAQAREEGRRNLRFSVFDATRDPAEQGFRPGSFHAVFAANVVHATPRIGETLGNLRSLLVPGGVIALIENVRQRPWADMIWGLTEGWWLFADPELRATSPLLDGPAWERVLEATGFSNPSVWPHNPALAATCDAALLLAERPEGETGKEAHPSALAVDPGDLEALRAALDEATLRLAPVTGAVWVTDGAGGGIAAAGRRARQFADLLPADLPLAWIGARAEALPILAALADERQERGRPAWALSGNDPAALAAALARTAAGEPWPVAAAWQSPPPAAAPAEPATAGEGAPAPADNRPTLATAFVAPRDETEREIAAVWSRALGVSPVGAFDNFLELGGDSLVGLQVARAIGERFDLGGRRFSLFENPTVAAIARFLAAGTPAAESAEGEGENEDAAFRERALRGSRRRDFQTGRRRGPGFS